MQLDSKKPKIEFADYAYLENRYKILTKIDPEAAHGLLNQAQHDVEARWNLYEQLAGTHYSPANPSLGT